MTFRAIFKFERHRIVNINHFIDQKLKEWKPQPGPFNIPEALLQLCVDIFFSTDFAKEYLQGNVSKEKFGLFFAQFLNVHRAKSFEILWVHDMASKFPEAFDSLIEPELVGYGCMQNILGEISLLLR